MARFPVRLSVSRARWSWRAGRPVRLVPVAPFVWWVFPWWWPLRRARAALRAAPVVLALLLGLGFVVAAFALFGWAALPFAVLALARSR
jgi:hypothetical protein